MSAFDDEFGLFGDDAPREDDERRPTLGARRIASTETIIDEIEPEDEPSPRRRRTSEEGRPPSRGGPPRSFPGGRRDRPARPPIDPALSQARATELLTFLAKKLVSRPDDVIVQMVEGDRGPIVELEVHPDDLGKVIGRSGRVAQALRTLVRAGAESRITVDIVDTEDDEMLEEDAEHAGDTEAVGLTAAVATPQAMEAGDDEFEGSDDDADADDDELEDDEDADEASASSTKPAAKGKTVDR